MLRPLLLLASFGLFVACATPPSYEAKIVDSPMPDELLAQKAFVGEWEIHKCMNAKQAEKVQFSLENQNLTIKRWQWKKDLLPLFEVEVKNEKQSVATYQSKDMHDLNPVLNHTTWTWSDNRVVGTFQWQPDKEDQRGIWSGVAMGQFFVKKDEPEKLYWNRWGTTHSTMKGLTQWKSSCVYTRVSPGSDFKASELDAKYDSFHLSQKKDEIESAVLKAKFNSVDPDESQKQDSQFLRKSRRESVLK